MMYRRTLLIALGVAAVALFGLVGAPMQADEKPADKAHQEHGVYVACAKACGVCTLQCLGCSRHCENLVIEGKKDHVKTMRLCTDCGEICATSGKIVARLGPLSATVCDACAKCCDTCGEACERFPDDEHMNACAKACRDCAKACRDMIKHAHREEK
jgi:hypothetical protein